MQPLRSVTVTVTCLLTDAVMVITLPLTVPSLDLMVLPVGAFTTVSVIASPTQAVVFDAVRSRLVGSGATVMSCEAVDSQPLASVTVTE